MRRQWPEPYTFKPERFAKDGENAGQDIWTFSTGPRIWYSSYLSDRLHFLRALIIILSRSRSLPVSARSLR